MVHTVLLNRIENNALVKVAVNVDVGRLDVFVYPDQVNEGGLRGNKPKS